MIPSAYKHPKHLTFPPLLRKTHFVFLLFILSLFTPWAQAQPAAAVPQVQTYDQLLTAIRQTRAASQGRIEQAVRQEKVREAWETGKLIDVHVLDHQRAGYDQQVLTRLAADLGMDRSELYRMLEFARTYPIVVPGRRLSWAHYKALITLEDPKIRGELEAKAEEEGWSRDKTWEEVHKQKTKADDAGDVLPDNQLTPAKPGKPYTYRIILAKKGPFKDKLAVDLGFSIYHRPKNVDKFKEGDLVSLVKGKLKKPKDASAADRFTYFANPIEIIDGDTFTAVIDLGFNIAIIQKLRLRALDAPEIESREGKEAKAFLEKMIQSKEHRAEGKEKKDANPMLYALSPLLIRTSKSDKYDRYLADVFVNGEYVNQKLIEEGFAVTVPD